MTVIKEKKWSQGEVEREKEKERKKQNKTPEHFLLFEFCLVELDIPSTGHKIQLKP